MDALFDPNMGAETAGEATADAAASADAAPDAEAPADVEPTQGDEAEKQE